MQRHHTVRGLGMHEQFVDVLVGKTIKALVRAGKSEAHVIDFLGLEVLQHAVDEMNFIGDDEVLTCLVRPKLLSLA